MGDIRSGFAGYFQGLYTGWRRGSVTSSTSSSDDAEEENWVRF